MVEGFPREFLFFLPSGKLPFVKMKTFQEKNQLTKILVESFICLFPNVFLMKS